jgi:hypothetical protein
MSDAPILPRNCVAEARFAAITNPRGPERIIGAPRRGHNVTACRALLKVESRS